jgi:hypothetical protein
MITYLEVFNKFVSALTGRPVGTRVQAEDLEDANIKLLDYVEQVKTEATGSILREAHAAATADVNCNLTWNEPFTDTDYNFIVQGYDSLGNPVEIYFRSKSTTKIVVKTLVNATLFAHARPYGGSSS